MFYSESADHYNCPVGAYTHGIDLPAEQQGELQGLMGTMLELGYLREAEIPNIPRPSRALWCRDLFALGFTRPVPRMWSLSDAMPSS